MKFSFLWIPAVFIVGLSFVACNQSSTAADSDREAQERAVYVKTMQQDRKAKDDEFAAHPKSPFASLYEDFLGLKYYEPDWNFRVKANWVQPDTAFIRDIADSKGGMRKYKFAGDLTFKLQSKPLQLPVFVEVENENLWFIMFRDLTNGKETYGGGRYIEMPKPDTRSEIFLDFNRAFNPYCHYNHNYSCPIVPQDCMLDAEIRAGEKVYKEEKKDSVTL
jgi:uncharacterized protein (DUF1684 family)